MASYLTSSEAETRLSSFDINAYLSSGFLEAASGALDASGPFIGVRYASEQVLAFPRSITLDGDTEDEVPEAVLDWVALEAYKLSIDEPPPIRSISIRSGGVTYAGAQTGIATRLQRALLIPYLRRTGSAL